MRPNIHQRIQEKLYDLIDYGAAPGFQLALGYREELIGVYSAGYRDPVKKRPLYDTSFMDLASLTKVISTVSLLIFALQNRLIPSLEVSLKQYFPFLVSDLKNRSLIEILEHRAGLSPTFTETEELSGGREEKKRYFLRRLDESYESSALGQVVYSDVGYMILGMLLEVVYSKRLRDVFSDFYPPELGLIYGPVDFRWDHWSWLLSVPTVARTYSLSENPVWLKGRAQDPRAAWLEGDAGHAGVFGNAAGIDAWAKELYLSYHGKGLRLSDQSLRQFIDFSRSFTRFLGGFDTPTSSESYVSQAGYRASSTTVGHLGYTGCSFWMDIERGYRMTLLSHRHGPHFNPDKLFNLRPGFHDWLYEEVFFKLKS